MSKAVAYIEHITGWFNIRTRKEYKTLEPAIAEAIPDDTILHLTDSYCVSLEPFTASPIPDTLREMVVGK